jgi:predicted protein tyrosine phosphatase
MTWLLLGFCGLALAQVSRAAALHFQASFVVPRSRGPRRLKAELQTAHPSLLRLNPHLLQPC